MVHGFALEGTSVVLAFGRPSLVERRFIAANDNGPRDPVKTVTVRRMLEQSGVAIKIKVPVTEFIGVAVATRISEEGLLTSSIELSIPTSRLNYRVFEEEGNHNVVAEWQNWARSSACRCSSRRADGAYMPYSQQVDGVMVGNNQARRKLAAEAGRRPNFLNRRKPGMQPDALSFLPPKHVKRVDPVCGRPFWRYALVSDYQIPTPPAGRARG